MEEIVVLQIVVGEIVVEEVGVLQIVVGEIVVERVGVEEVGVLHIVVGWSRRGWSTTNCCERDCSRRG